jgi:hypothetical protein
MRLRILDFNTPWFWFVCFKYTGYASGRIEATLYGPQIGAKWWFYFWRWEPLPDIRPLEAVYEDDIELAGNL